MDYCFDRNREALKDDTLCVLVYEPSLTIFYDIVNLCDISDVLPDPGLLLFVEGLPGDVKDYLYKYVDVRDLKRLLRRVGEVTALVEEAPFMYYIQNFMQEKTQKFLEQVYEAKKDVRTEVIDTAKLGKENFRVVLETIQECLPKLDSWRDALEEYRSWKIEG